MAIFGLVGPKDIQSDFMERLAAPFDSTPRVLVSKNRTHCCSLGTTTDAWHNILIEMKGSLLAFSGHLENRADLMVQTGLEPAASDNDLLAALFTNHGPAMFDQVQGLFSSAVWIGETGSLTVRTDSTGGCFGNYYTTCDGVFAFSSRLSSLVALPRLPREVCPSAVAELFATGYVLPPRTLIAGIQKSWPGQKIFHSEGSTQAHSLPQVSRERFQGQDPLPPFRALIENQVKPLATTPETGWLLSGGIDSSVLVACGSQFAPDPLPTFSATFPGSELNEEDAAREVANHVGSQANYFDLGSRDELEDLPRISWELDEPFLDYSAIPSFALFKRLRPHARGLVSGDGPDHLFGRYYPLGAKCRLRALAPLVKGIGKIKAAPYVKMLSLILESDMDSAYRTLFSYPSWNGNPSTYRKLLADPPEKTFPLPLEGIDMDLENSGNFEDVMEKLIKYDLLIDGAFGVFNKVGKMARANDLKVHWPYLSSRVVTFVQSLPIDELVQGSFKDHLMSSSTYKYLLSRKLAPDLLPPAVLKKSKGGFTPPLTRWLLESLPDTGEKLLSDGLRKAGILDLKFVDRICQEHRQGTRSWTTILFLLISFDLWYNMYILEPQLRAPGFKLSETWMSGLPGTNS